MTGVGRHGVAVVAAAAAAVQDSFSRSAILRAVIGVMDYDGTRKLAAPDFYGLMRPPL